MQTPITIGISFSATNYGNYPAWIKGDHAGIEIVELSWKKNNTNDLDKCHALILTGGIDISPVFYKAQRTDYPNRPAEWNPARDVFEQDLFKTAQLASLPVLGICRGMQLVNVALGGSLIPDIEETGKENHRSEEGRDKMHRVEIHPNTLLQTICGSREGKVNSAHHQAIDKLAEPLLANAFSPDGIVEGLEWKYKTNHAPMLCVQWHPERLQDKNTNPLSKNIRQWLLTQAAKYQL